MVLYRVYKVSNGEELFTRIPNKVYQINNPRFKNFIIKNDKKYITSSALDDSIESILSTEDNTIYDKINIDVIIARYKLIYSVVKLSGRGLMSMHGVTKYIDEQILAYIEDHIKNKYNIHINFMPFDFDNNHFSKDYWGDKITTKLGYNSSNRMYIKISCSNFNKLFEKYPDLETYYNNGIIKSIKGISPDLEYKGDDKIYPGSFKFSRNGVFNCDFSNIIFFNDFLTKLIDQGFFGSY